MYQPPTISALQPGETSGPDTPQSDNPHEPMDLSALKAPALETRTIGRPPEPMSAFLTDMSRAASIEFDPRSGAEERVKSRSILRKYRNCCGQYASAAALSALGVATSTGQVIELNNRAGMFTSPSSLMRGLRRLAPEETQIKQYNYKHRPGGAEIAKSEATDHLVRHLESGGTAVLLVGSVSKSGKTIPHWVAVTGARLDESGQPKSWLTSDAANMAESHDFTGEISHDDLLEAWHCPISAGPLNGLVEYRNSWIAVGGEELRLEGLEARRQLFSKSPITNSITFGSEAAVKSAFKIGRKLGEASKALRERKPNE